MKKIKEYLSYLGLFLIVWFLAYHLGVDYSQGQDRKKFIFHPVEYYSEMYFWIGLLFAGSCVGYLIYSVKKDKTQQE